MSSIKKKDMVLILAGKDKGKKGEVRKVLKGGKKVLVSGMNMVVKHAKPSQNKPGGIQKIESPLDISNVSLICPKCDRASRVKIEILKSKDKIRLCTKCKGQIV